MKFVREEHYIGKLQGGEGSGIMQLHGAGCGALDKGAREGNVTPAKGYLGGLWDKPILELARVW